MQSDFTMLELIRRTLSEYCSAIVLGMERVPDDLVLKLEPYCVRDGGSAAFFLSGQSNAFEYNQHLFKDGKGVMPVRLDKSDSAADLTFDTNWAIPTSQPSIPVARFMALNGANQRWRSRQLFQLENRRFCKADMATEK